MSDSFAAPWTVAHQAPLSSGFPRQEYWRGLPFSSPGDLPKPRIVSETSALTGRCFTIEPWIWRLARLPWWLSGKESACQCRRHQFDPWVRKIPWRRKWQPPSVFLPGKSHGRRSLVGFSPWPPKSWTGLTDSTTNYSAILDHNRYMLNKHPHCLSTPIAILYKQLT